MPAPDACQHRLALHGLAVELSCAVPCLDDPIRRALREFHASEFPPGFSPTVGSISTYDHTAVLRHLSPTARPLSVGGGVMELYHEGERFWLIDDRWGLAEINLLRGAWHAWVLPKPSIDPARLVENAVLWPLAQLLRGKGLSLIPAISLSLDGGGVLIISPFGIEHELRAAIAAGARVIGQQWSALREEDGRVSMLRMPGRIETMAPPRLRSGATSRMRLVGESVSESGSTWTDFCAGMPGSVARHAFVDSVVVVDRGRRPMPMIRAAASADALPLLKQTWPILELHPHRRARAGQTTVRLAQQCAIYEAQLSRDPNDFVRMLEIATESGVVGSSRRVRVSVHAPRSQLRVPA